MEMFARELLANMELFAREWLWHNESEFSGCQVIIVKKNPDTAESRMDFDIWDRGTNDVFQLNSVTKTKKIQNLQQYDIKSHYMKM